VAGAEQQSQRALRAVNLFSVRPSPGRMTPPAPTPPALAAPGLEGPISILNQPISGPRSNRRSRNRPYSHAHFEIDLASKRIPTEDAPLIQRLETFLSEKELVEASDLLILAAGLLHSLSARRFRWIDKWEVEPGGALPTPEQKAHREPEAPVGDLVKALEGGAWATAVKARSFSVSLSDHSGNRVDAVVRRVHRQRRHALSLDLYGSWTKAAMDDLTGSLRSRLPVSQSTLTKFQYA
jgi:hypothetical protein